MCNCKWLEVKWSSLALTLSALWAVKSVCSAVPLFSFVRHVHELDPPTLNDIYDPIQYQKLANWFGSLLIILVEVRIYFLFRWTKFRLPAHFFRSFQKSSGIVSKLNKSIFEVLQKCVTYFMDKVGGLPELGSPKLKWIITSTKMIC